MKRKVFALSILSLGLTMTAFAYNQGSSAATCCQPKAACCDKAKCCDKEACCKKTAKAACCDGDKTTTDPAPAAQH